jgi:hypothetical protein
MNRDCSFNADTRRLGVHRCTAPATHLITDRRLLPDGKRRPAMPACEAHALGLLEMNPTAYMVTFGLWARA